MSTAVLPLLVLAVASFAAVSRVRARRRWSRVKASGGRKSFVLNILERP